MTSSRPRGGQSRNPGPLHNGQSRVAEVGWPEAAQTGSRSRRNLIGEPDEPDESSIPVVGPARRRARRDRKSTRLNSSHVSISYAAFCLKKKKAARQEMPDRGRRSRDLRVASPMLHKI